MKNPIFKDREEVEMFISDCVVYSIANRNINIEKSIDEAEQLGYIQQSELEKAREEFYNIFDIDNLNVVIKNYIKELEGKNEK